MKKFGKKVMTPRGNILIEEGERMARPQKEGLDYRPQQKAFEHAKTKGGNFLKKYLRNSSNAYIKKKEVRDFVFERDGFACVLCGCENDLQVDHIISVYQATAENIFFINSPDNLRTLCGSCNARRDPNAKA